jgi:tRNA (guanine37-N1)-methyltransferase
MRFVFVTLFKNLVSSYFEDSILKRAISKGLFEVEFINFRDFSTNKHNKVDDSCISGGAGMALTPQPLFDTILDFKSKNISTHIIFLVPSGKKFTQKDSARLAKHENVLFVCGRYEGIDERVLEEFADELFSIGDFVLTGGELPALVICDAIARNIKGVLGNECSKENESFEDELLEAPTFAKPSNFRNFFAPSIFLKGNHSKIADFKKGMAIMKTKFHRPDLYKKHISTLGKHDEK